MELSLSHTLHLFNIFREYDGKDNCAQVLEDKIYKIFGTKYLNDEHDCNVVSMKSLNIHDANDMQSHKLGEAMFDEDDIFCPPSFDEKIYYDESIPLKIIFISVFASSSGTSANPCFPLRRAYLLLLCKSQ